MDSAELDRLARETPRENLPELLGVLVSAEARVRLRLAEPAGPAPATETRVIDAAEAARIAGASKRWVLAATKGMKFRVDLSRKQPRLVEDAFRAWLAGRRR
jgi:hypothetical protein